MRIDACLASAAVVVAVLAPLVLARPALVTRQPRLAAAAWLFTGASVILALLAAGVSLLQHRQLPARLLGVLVLVAVLTRLSFAASTTALATRRRRRRHRQMLALLGRPDHAIGALVIDAPQRMAYCMPGRAGTIVVTSGARAALSAAELDAVLAHERAHLEGRHHLVLSIGYTLGRTLPGLGLFRLLGGHVAQLMEMAADDAAAARHGRRTLAGALLTMGTGPTPVATLGIAGPSVLPRALRLSADEPARPSRPARVILLASSALLIAAPLLTALIPCPHPW